jgi:hypothetical protein
MRTRVCASDGYMEQEHNFLGNNPPAFWQCTNRSHQCSPGGGYRLKSQNLGRLYLGKAEDTGIIRDLQSESTASYCGSFDRLERAEACFTLRRKRYTTRSGNLSLDAKIKGLICQSLRPDGRNRWILLISLM